MDSKTFQIALVTRWINDEQTKDPIEDYVRVVYGREAGITEDNGEYTEEVEDILGVKCEYKDFSTLDEKAYELYYLADGYCPPSIHREQPFKIRGSWQSLNPKYYKATVLSCLDLLNAGKLPAGSKCATAAAIANAMDFISVELYAINRYFEDSDFAGEDVHPFIEYFYHALQSAYGQAHVFLMSKTELTKKDGLFGVEKEVTDTFFEIYHYYSYSRGTRVKSNGKIPWYYAAWF